MGGLMKKVMIFMVGLMTSIMVLANSSECPSGSAKSFVCKSTPIKGDHDLAAASWDSITVCQKRGREALLIFEDDGKFNDAPSEVLQMAGGVRYVLMADEGTRISLSVTTGLHSSKKIPARYFIEFIHANPILVASSQYTCER